MYTIEKSRRTAFSDIIDSYKKMALPYANIEITSVFNKSIAKAQQSDPKQAKKSYTQAFLPYLKGFCIALDPEGENLDSYQFASLLKNRSEISFFIGGSHGFEEHFLNQHQKVISLSRLTYAHKIAEVVLFEQIYRGLCINHGHPYHK